MLLSNSTVHFSYTGVVSTEITTDIQVRWWIDAKIYFVTVRENVLFFFQNFKSAKHSREIPVSVSDREIKIRVSFPVPVTLSIQPCSTHALSRPPAE